LFDDGTTSTLKNPTRVYSKAGTYSVRLITTNNNGCKDTLNTSITIHGLPKIVAKDTVICLGDNGFGAVVFGLSRKNYKILQNNRLPVFINFYKSAG